MKDVTTPARLRRVMLVCSVALALAGSAGPAWAQPSFELRLSSHPGLSFPNFASIVIPEQGAVDLEIWLRGTLDDVQVSSVRVRLNEVPLTPFLAVNRLPRGVRVIFHHGASLSPEYSLLSDRENLLSFSATDAGGTKYQARFFIRPDSGVTAPSLAPERAAAPIKEVEAPEQQSVAMIRFTSDWPRSTRDGTLTLEAEVTDEEGLRRIVIEVNGRDVEEILLENERPVRKRNGWVARSTLPGMVQGDGSRVELSIPVKLTRDLNVVALRVENVLGLRSRADRSVERLR